ncbi:MAG: hypothetical protein ABI317_00570 [Gaiellales bacterium]
MIARLASPTLASLVAGLTLLFVLASLPLTALAHQGFGADVEIGAAITLSFSAVGMIIARREPRNPIGWVLLATGLLLILSTLGDARLYLRADYGFHHGTLPLGPLAIMIGQAWPAPLLLGPLAILLFPDGRVPSRWRWPVRVFATGSALVVVMLVGAGLAAAVEGRVRVDSSGDLVSSAPRSLSGALPSAAFALLLLTLGVCGVAFVVRQVASFHGSVGERRQQLKWVMCGAATSAVSIPLFIWHPSTGSTVVGPVLGLVGGVGIAALPISIGVAILRYRLYEIDRLISRTLAYAIVTGILVGLYFGFVSLTADALPISSPVAVAAATLAAAALFNPLRIRVQHGVDRRFNRARYDAEATVAAFAATLRDAVDLDTVRGELVRTVQASIEATLVDVWLSPPIVRAPPSD